MKVNAPQSLPRFLDMGQFLAPAGQEKDPAPREYELYAILVHSGTALGGHYKTYIKVGTGMETDTPPTGAEGWCEFDDETVRPLPEQTLRAILGGEVKEDTGAETHPAPSSHPTEAPAEALRGEAVRATPPGGSVAAPPRSPSTTNAYMLVYRRCSTPHSAASQAHAMDIPTHVSEAVAKDEEAFSELCSAFRLRMELVPLRVHAPAAVGGSFMLRLPPTYTLGEATTTAQSKVAEIKARLAGLAAPSPCRSGDVQVDHSLCRLRRFNVITAKPGRTFGGKETISLADLGFRVASSCGHIDMLLEERSAEDPAFAEFDPDDCHIQVAVLPGSDAVSLQTETLLPLLQGTPSLAAQPPDHAPDVVRGLLLVQGKQVGMAPGALGFPRRLCLRLLRLPSCAMLCPFQNATVGDLRHSIATAYALREFCLVHDGSSDTIALEDETMLLRDCLTGHGPVIVDPTTSDGEGKLMEGPVCSCHLGACDSRLSIL